MNIDEAILQLRRDPRHAALVRDSYLDENTRECAERFFRSGEFEETLRLLGSHSRGSILDLGAGTGIASYAFACSHARLVYALEPDPSNVVGRGAIARVTKGLNVQILEGQGERIPLPDNAVDVVYVRQVLHHASDLPRLLKDCERVLRPNGLFLACREHVVDNDEQLRVFLKNHPIHQLVGGEHAYPLQSYLDAIQTAGLCLDQMYGHWDTVINAFPAVRTSGELETYPQKLLERRLGVIGQWLGGYGFVRTLIWKRLNRPVSGRLSAFLAHKP